MPAAFPPIEPVKVRGAFDGAGGPVALDLVVDESAAFAAIVRAIGDRSGGDIAARALDIGTRMFRERTSSMLDDLAEVWWTAEHEGARVRPFASLPIGDRAELRARVKKLLVDRVPDALGDQAVLEAERKRLLDLPAIALQRANAEHERKIERERAQRGSGAIAMSAIFAAGEASIAHVGDCRAYRLRSGRADQLTREHTLSEEHQNVVTQAIGFRTIDPQLVTTPVARGDVYLLLTRSLSRLYPAHDIVREVQRSGVEAARRLVKAAGSTENRAAVAVEIL